MKKPVLNTLYNLNILNTRNAFNLKYSRIYLNPQFFTRNGRNSFFSFSSTCRSSSRTFSNKTQSNFLSLNEYSSNENKKNYSTYTFNNRLLKTKNQAKISLFSFCSSRKNDESSTTTNKTNKKEKKGILKQFGVIGIVLYFSYWILTGVIIYFLVKKKYIKREKMEEIINKNEYTKNYYSKIKNTFGDSSIDFALAYCINAILEVVRLPSFLLFARYFIKVRK